MLTFNYFLLKHTSHVYLFDINPGFDFRWMGIGKLCVKGVTPYMHDSL